MIEDKKLDELFMLAMHATKGERGCAGLTNTPRILGRVVRKRDGIGLAECLRTSDRDADGERTLGFDHVESNAAFIAACSPEAIMAMVEEIRSKRAFEASMLLKWERREKSGG